jgi:hypothetical protein
LQQDWARVEHCASVGFKHFQATWTSLHPCAYAARRVALRALERLAEVDDLAQAAHATGTLLLQASHWAGSAAGSAAPGEGGASSGVGAAVAAAVEELLAAWHCQRPDGSDPPEVWTDLCTDRRLGLGALLQRLDRGSSSASLWPHVNGHLASLGFLSASAAVRHGNKSVAKLHIASATELLRGPTPRAHEASLQLKRVQAVTAYNKCVLLGSSDDAASALGNLGANPKERSKALANIQKTTVSALSILFFFPVFMFPSLFFSVLVFFLAARPPARSGL